MFDAIGYYLATATNVVPFFKKMKRTSVCFPTCHPDSYSTSHFDLQASLFLGRQDSSLRRTAVLGCHQRGACPSCLVHFQREDQTVCGQREGDLQQGEVQ